ncbi:MAG: hypothetical protein ACP5I4_01895, partial [Oceanipulchritudo sp.]
MKKRHLLLTTLAGLALAAPAQAAVIVDYTLADNGSESTFFNGTPTGGWTVGATESTFDTGFSATSVLGVGTTPAGTVPLFIGGATGTYASTTVLPTTVQLRTLRNATTGVNNAILNRFDADGNALFVRSALVVESSNWLTSTSGVTGLDSYNLGVIQSGSNGTNVTATVRAVVRDSGNYYVSNTAFTGVSGSLDITDFGAETWYNLGTGAALLSTNFADYGTAGSVAFSAITGVGMVYEYSTSDTVQREYRLGGLQVTAVPEPSTYALLAGF